MKKFYEKNIISTTINFCNAIICLWWSKNGNPLLVIGGATSTLYNENNEVLFKIENGESVETGATLNKLEDGSFELVKDGKVIAKIDANGQILTYLYSTGEILTISSKKSPTSISRGWIAFFIFLKMSLEYDIIKSNK